MNPPMRIHAVTVCLHYDDFLEHTIRVNQPHLDDWVIVTDQEDKGTRAVCERYGVRVVFCPYFKDKGSNFNKALAINIGLANTATNGGCWILHLDADIALPRDTRKLLNNLPLDTKSIYGVDRSICPSHEEWISYLSTPDLNQKHYFCRAHKDWKHGTRLLHFDYGSYVPIGYFQLWHTDSEILRYPTVQCSEGEHTDVLHGLQWPRERRHLIPELYAIHLESGPTAGMGINWNGRKSPRFEPKKPEPPKVVGGDEKKIVAPSAIVTPPVSVAEAVKKPGPLGEIVRKAAEPKEEDSEEFDHHRPHRYPEKPSWWPPNWPWPPSGPFNELPPVKYWRHWPGRQPWWWPWWWPWPPWAPKPYWWK